MGDRNHYHRVGNEIGLGLVLREAGWRLRSELILYSHKRALVSSSLKIAFVLPTGCDARGFLTARVVNRSNPQPSWNQLRSSIIDIATASTATTSDRYCRSARLRLPSGSD